VNRANYKDISWQDLMIKAQDGDDEAYATLLESLTPVLRAYVAKNIREQNDVEDIVQDILLSIHLARHTYDSTRPFNPWLFSIAKRRIIDRLRLLSRWSRDVILDSGDLNELNLAVDYINEDLPDLKQTFKELSPVKRKALELIAVEGHTTKEAGAKLNLNESAFRVMYHRTLKKLRETIKK
jgi:RNA polymerase sigma-70 factor, ECF subfamily